MRSTGLRKVLFAAALLSVPAIAQAHPGHGGSDGHGWNHWLFDHVLPALAIGCIAVALLTLAARRLVKPPRR